jgi:hypothetical protein
LAVAVSTALSPFSTVARSELSVADQAAGPIVTVFDVACRSGGGAVELDAAT